METFLYMLPVIIVFVGFYFFVIRPLQRKYGADKEYRPDKKVGTDFTTISYPDSLISGVADRYREND